MLPGQTLIAAAAFNDSLGVGELCLDLVKSVASGEPKTIGGLFSPFLGHRIFIGQGRTEYYEMFGPWCFDATNKFATMSLG